MARLLEHCPSMMLEHRATSNAERTERNELTKMHPNLSIRLTFVNARRGA